MGLERTGATLICAAKKIGAEFEHCATIGRQTFGVPKPLLRRMSSVLDLPHMNVDALSREEYSEPFFYALGSQEVNSIDFSDYEGASHIHDMNRPIPEYLSERYSFIFDGGSLEHIFNLPQAFKNCMEMLKIGGYFVQVTMANNALGHGFWQLSPEVMYRMFAPENGFRTVAVMLQEVTNEISGRGSWFLALDPQHVGWRGNVQNKHLTYIGTIAQRISNRPIFAEPPQQSDYQAKWQREERHDAHPGFRRTAAKMVRRVIPPSLERAVRSPYNRASFIRLQDDDVLRARFPSGR